tara:strand:+ start:1821 stop:3101 length:1281 start_codon:yes stop_codon:yes gene_type:complete
MKNNKIAIIGLGYVGLPLARLFATKFSVFGFDINSKRVSEIMQGIDSTLEIDNKTLKSVLVNRESDQNGLFCTTQIDEIKDCNYYIITVPTPINKYNQPDLSPLIKASETVGSLIKEGDIVIYESTVYPGATEDDCVPVLEKVSGLKFNVDFYVGYSPERINPGDKEHTVDKILKVTSGSNNETAKKVDDLYNSVITAGTYLAATIKVAEAAKVIENSQRDINIAFVNELAKIFNLMNINTQDVLAAAGTKWNFLPFKPGLVGGHCIGVDPYYLSQKAQEFGYNPEIILAGRRMNDSMGNYVASEVVKLMIKKNIPIKNSSILILGFTFKENCPDIRNTRVIDIYKSFHDYDINIDVYDPWANSNEVKKEFGFDLINKISKNYSAVILAVAHNDFLTFNLKSYLNENGVLFDVKGILNKNKVDGAL